MVKMILSSVGFTNFSSTGRPKSIKVTKINNLIEIKKISIEIKRNTKMKVK